MAHDCPDPTLSIRSSQYTCTCTLLLILELLNILELFNILESITSFFNRPTVQEDGGDIIFKVC